MKRISAILILFCLAATARAASFSYKATLTITNLPPASAVLSADGDIRTFTNATPTLPGKFLQTTNTLQAAATNLWQHALLYTFTNINSVKLGTNDAGSPTNTVVFETTTDHFVTFTTLSNWCSIIYSTNPVTPNRAVRVPHTLESPSVQTQVVTGVIDIIGDTNATNRVKATAPALDNFLGADTTATTYTNKSFANGTLYSMVASLLSGQFINVGASNLIVTNFSSPGTATGSLQMGAEASASGNYSIAVGNKATNSGAASVIMGNDAFNQGVSSIVIGDGSRSSNANAVVIGPFSTATNTYFLLLSVGSGGTLNTSSFGPMTDNQVWIGSASESVWIPGATHFQKSLFWTNAWATNIHIFRGFVANVFGSNWLATNLTFSTERRYGSNWLEGVEGLAIGTVTTLATSNNVVTLGTNQAVAFGGAVGVPVINSMSNWFPGRVIEGYNSNGTALLISHLSGYDGISGNRIFVPGATNAGDFVTVPSGGWFRARHDGTYWRLMYPTIQSLTLGATNVPLQEATNGVLITDGTTTTNNIITGPGIRVLATNNVAGGTVDKQFMVNLPFGGIFYDGGTTESAILSNVGQFYRITTNCAVASTNLVATSLGTNLINVFAGYYQVRGYVRGASGGTVGTRMVGALFTNGVRASCYEGGAVSPTNQFGGLNIVGPPIYLPAGTVMDLRLACTNLGAVSWTNFHVNMSANWIAP